MKEPGSYRGHRNPEIKLRRARAALLMACCCLSNFGPERKTERRWAEECGREGGLGSPRNWFPQHRIKPYP